VKIYTLEREQWIPRPLPVVFEFFSHAENLESITPAWLHFKIRTATPIAMHPGTLIDYTIRLGGIPLRWRTCITQWEPERRFVDEQQRGPYALWEHTHTFEACGEGVLMTDRVRYALPFGPLGRAVHAVALRSALGAIFDHRFRRIRELLEEHRSDPALQIRSLGSPGS